MKSFSDLIKEGKERLNELEKEVNKTTEKAVKELVELTRVLFFSFKD